jgi:hypothetical protein
LSYVGPPRKETVETNTIMAMCTASLGAEEDVLSSVSKEMMMMMMIFLLRYALRRAGPATAIYKGNRTIKAG